VTAPGASAVTVRKSSAVRPFGSDVGFTMTSDPWLQWVSCNPAFKVHERIMGAAQLRMNWWGHAPFMPGELVQWMGDKTNGSTISKSLGLLKKRKQIAPASTSLCIILNSYQFKRQTTASKRDVCIEARHVTGDLRHRRWFCTGEWSGYEQYSGEWDKHLEEEAEQAGSLVLAGFKYDLSQAVSTSVVAGEVERDAA
jgi:hypothetical protein